MWISYKKQYKTKVRLQKDRYNLIILFLASVDNLIGKLKNELAALNTSTSTSSDTLNSSQMSVHSMLNSTLDIKSILLLYLEVYKIKIAWLDRVD